MSPCPEKIRYLICVFFFFLFFPWKLTQLCQHFQNLCFHVKNIVFIMIFLFVYSSWSHPTTAEYDCMIFVIWLYLVNTKDMPIAAVKLELHLGEYLCIFFVKIIREIPHQKSVFEKCKQTAVFWIISIETLFFVKSVSRKFILEVLLLQRFSALIFDCGLCYSFRF